MASGAVEDGVTQDECVHHVEAWTALKLTAGRCSAALVRELAIHMADRTLDVFGIYDEIGCMEGAAQTRPTSTKPAARFKRNPLKGLWHKHYASPRFIPKNLAIHWTEAK